MATSHTNMLWAWWGLWEACVLKGPLPDADFIGLDLAWLILMLLRRVSLTLKLAWEHWARILVELPVHYAPLIAKSNRRLHDAWPIRASQDLLPSIKPWEWLLSKLLVDLGRNQSGCRLHTTTVINKCGWWRGSRVETLQLQMTLRLMISVDNLLIDVCSRDL